MTPADRHPDLAPHDGRLGRRLATQEWHDLTMVHWRVDARQVARRLPPELQPDTFDGSAWVSLVPFRMVDVTAAGVPPLPLLSRFDETNVRTYVDGPHGPAVWFESLEVPHPWIPPLARIGLGVPYTWARTRISWRGGEVRYFSRRRLPGPTGAESLVGARPGRSRPADELDRFLTNRWGAYSVLWGRTVFTPVQHPTWQLLDAELTVLRDELAEAVGLGVTTVERVVHVPAVREITFGLPVGC